MGGLWSELAKKLAEKWFSLLVLPGALYLAVTGVALILGHTHALDAGRLTREITAYAKNPTATSTGGQVVLLVAALVGAGAIGLVAQGVGTFIERGVLASQWQRWPLPLRYVARRAVSRRRRQWDAADAAYVGEFRQALAPDPADRPDPGRRHRAAGARSRVAVERPDRPTWSGDRMHAVATRLDRDHHLDLATVWPCLWLTIPDADRAQISDARSALSRATTLAAWSILYLALTPWWWPAAAMAVVLAVSARHRMRSATDTYATLIEATTRLFAVALAERLGLDHTGPLTTRLGRTLTDHLDSRSRPGSSSP
ncbi:hypothetical protein [Nocardia sp. NPDC058705]|uniref:hypothetical protein n=1 Tax=Nocardia sp. NPDC058705 TaxID=3346609 RepID=UPI0036738E8C